MTCRHRGGWRQQIDIRNYDGECDDETGEFGSGSDFMETTKSTSLSPLPPAPPSQLVFDVSIDSGKKEDIFSPRSSNLVVFDTSAFDGLALDSDDDEIGSGWIDEFIITESASPKSITTNPTTVEVHTTVTTTPFAMMESDQISDDDFFSLVEMLESNMGNESTKRVDTTTAMTTAKSSTTQKSLLKLVEEIKNSQLSTHSRTERLTTLSSISTTQLSTTLKPSLRPSLLALIEGLNEIEQVTVVKTTTKIPEPSSAAITTTTAAQITIDATSTGSTTTTTESTTKTFTETDEKTDESTETTTMTTTSYTTTAMSTTTTSEKDESLGRSVVNHGLFSIVQRNAIRPSLAPTTKLTATPITTKRRLSRKDKIELKKKRRAALIEAKRERKQKQILAANARRDRRIQAEKDKRVYDLLRRNQLRLNDLQMKDIRTDAKKVQQERTKKLSDFEMTLRRLNDLEARRIIHGVNEAKRKAAEDAEIEHEFWLLIEEMEKTTSTTTTTTSTTSTTSTTTTTSTPTSSTTTTSTIPSVTMTETFYDDDTTTTWFSTTTTSWSTSTETTTATGVKPRTTPWWRATPATSRATPTSKTTTRQASSRWTTRRRTTTTTQPTTKPFNYYVTNSDGNLDYQAIIRHISNNNKECTQFGTIIQNAIRNKGRINIRVFNHFVDFCNAKAYRSPIQNYLESLGVTFVTGSIKQTTSTIKQTSTTTTSTSTKTFAQASQAEADSTITPVSTISEKKVKVGRPRPHTTESKLTTITSPTQDSNNTTPTTMSMPTKLTSSSTKSTSGSATTTTTEMVIQMTLHTKLQKPTTTDVSRRSGAPPTEVTPWSFTDSTRYTKKPKSTVSGK